MWTGFTDIATNLGTNFETITTVVVAIGCMLFFAVDFKKGAIITFILSGGLFMWFYQAGYNYGTAMILFLMSLVIMALSLYAVSKSTERGTLI